MGSIDESIAIIGVALAAAAIPILYFYFRYRTRAAAQATIRAALEKGQALSPEMLERLLEPVVPSVNRRNTDLRRGIILIALGVGIAVIGLAAAPMWQQALAVSALPSMIGLAYVALWKFAPRA